MTNDAYPVAVIRKYLLGQLPESETERLDEQSIADDECAELVRAVEYDLADAFVRGELHGTELEYFRARFMTTSRRREAVRFAEALQSLAVPSGQPRVPEPSHGERPAGGPRWTRWLLVAAVFVLAMASAWQAFDNRALRARLAGAESAREALERDRQRRDADASQRRATVQPSAGAEQTPLATLVLAPQLRGASRVPTLALTGSSGDLVVRLDLEPVDYPAYTAMLLTATGTREAWRADQLSARSIGGQKTLDLHLPVTVLSPQEYVIRVSGVPARGALEIVGEYRFAVVR